MTTVTPVFLFCLPRSGSTLVQRVLAAHDGVAATGEPWLLLPFMYTLARRGVRRGYDHRQTAGAIRAFTSQLPGGHDAYARELRRFALALYRQAGGEDARFFVDKSPPYYLVAEEIIALFPEAKFVFLWRHPLSVVSSNITTFGYGPWQRRRHWNPDHFRVPLFNGLSNLVAAYAANRDRAFAIRYEELILGGHEPWRRLADYVGIDFDPGTLERFVNVQLVGPHDPTGTRAYRALSDAPLEKWRESITNPIRRAWCRRYVDWIGRERLGIMGYDADALLAELEAVPAGRRDVARDALTLVQAVRDRRRRAEALRYTASVSAWRFLLDAHRGPAVDGATRPMRRTAGAA